MPTSAVRASRWLLGLMLCAAPLAAQSRTADSLWAAGDYAGARAAYTAALHDNPGWVRALYRLGILAAWDGQLDSALALFRDAREVEPGEPDVRLWQAKVLAWKGRLRESVLRYDSLLAEDPANHDARFGRAQALSWWGKQGEADEAFRALLDDNPDDAETLVALARMRQWAGRPDEASAYAARALRAAPGDRDAQEVQAQARALTRPRVEATLGYSHDSDKNNAFWQTLGTSLIIIDGVRAIATVGALEATDPARNGHRLHAEAGATWWHGNLSLTGALGARRLSPDFAADRSLATWRAGASLRVSPTAGIGAGYAHYSFDETALLIGRDLDIDELSADADVQLGPRTSLGLGAGYGWLSDDNTRHSLVAAVNQRVLPRVTVGAYGRLLGYDTKGVGYFSPDRFLVGEARVAWTRAVERWETRVSGGLGAQQVGGAAAAQTEWHLEGRVARRWATINEVGLSAGYTNSAVSSTTGAFNYYTVVLNLRLGL